MAVGREAGEAREQVVPAAEGAEDGVLAAEVGEGREADEESADRWSWSAVG